MNSINNLSTEAKPLKDSLIEEIKRFSNKDEVGVEFWEFPKNTKKIRMTTDLFCRFINHKISEIQEITDKEINDIINANHSLSEELKIVNRENKLLITGNFKKDKEIERLHLTDTECSQCGRKKISFDGNLFCYHCCWAINVELQKQNQELKEKIIEIVKKWQKQLKVFNVSGKGIYSMFITRTVNFDIYCKDLIKELNSLVEGGK